MDERIESDVNDSTPASRAVRRHHTARLKKNRQGYHGARFSEEGRLTGKALGSAVSHPAACSCHMCSNARRYFGRTLKEISDDQMATLDERESGIRERL